MKESDHLPVCNRCSHFFREFTTDEEQYLYDFSSQWVYGSGNVYVDNVVFAIRKQVIQNMKNRIDGLPPGEMFLASRVDFHLEGTKKWKGGYLTLIEQELRLHTKQSFQTIVIPRELNNATYEAQDAYVNEIVDKRIMALEKLSILFRLSEIESISTVEKDNAVLVSLTNNRQLWLRNFGEERLRDIFIVSCSRVVDQNRAGRE
jgi:hypothetical protein